MTLDNSRLIEENGNLQKTVDLLQSQAEESEVALGVKDECLGKLAEELNQWEVVVREKEKLLTTANGRVSPVCVDVLCVCIRYVRVFRCL